MLRRKYEAHIKEFLKGEPQKILLINGARQVGKSYLIRHVGRELFKNYVEINLKADQEGARVFAKVNSPNDFYIQLSAIAGSELGNKQNTLIFLDEIQSYPHLLTMLKFLNEDGKFTYVASGSQLGVALSQTPSVPIGSITIEEMYPLDFEEFLMAMGCGKEVLDHLRNCFERKATLSDSLHHFMIQQFRLYLLVGGLPEAVNKFLKNRNMTQVRKVQSDILALYRVDASQYDAPRKLVIRKIYDMVPSLMENKKKRIIVKKIEETSGHKQFSDYAEEFEYLTNSGIVLSVQAISNPRFPLIESESKNLLKLYMNDVGLLTNLLYGTNINAVLNDEKSVNLGSVYESVIAQELHAHGFKLHYYDNKVKGEVDYLIDDYKSLSVLPIEVKSGKDYKSHSALDCFLGNKEYNVRQAIVFSNEQKVHEEKGILYLPIYFSMCLNNQDEEECIIPPIEFTGL